MTTLKVAAQPGPVIADIPLGAGGLRYVGFAAHRLAANETLALESTENELCIVILSGTVSVTVRSVGSEASWQSVGERNSVFEDKSPYAVYVPSKSSVTVVGESAAEVAVARAPGGPLVLPARLIRPEQMKRSVRGRGSNTRYVCDILPETEPANSLLVVEVITPPGNSSSYPPHKHDTEAIPQESRLEETYYHRLNPPQGFAFQRVYTDERDIDEAICVEDHDVVKVPRGYHPVVVPHGYTSYYLNVMAGPVRTWHFHNDPQHEWMLESQ
ncbi:MAG TPA: 5-deoxy-glucuronate isomerase [Burkholderiaceae bacterium]|nr:5-deoxy-glucuronate isomerase [Burkholderiaceae bacterium]